MHCTVIGPNLHTSKIVTAISVSERLLEMAAFYIPIYAAEGDSVMKLLTSGFSGNATTPLAYILLGSLRYGDRYHRPCRHCLQEAEQDHWHHFSA